MSDAGLTGSAGLSADRAVMAADDDDEGVKLEAGRGAGCALTPTPAVLAPIPAAAAPEGTGGSGVDGGVTPAERELARVDRAGLDGEL